MNVLNTLRKPYFAYSLSILILFTACNQYDDLSNQGTIIDSYFLSKTHKDIINRLNASKAKIMIETKSESLNPEYEDLYLENAEFLNNHSLEELFIKNNLDTEIISELEYFEANKDNYNIYQELIQNFNFETEKEAFVLFTIIEVKKFVEQEINNLNKKINLTKSQVARISWGCALAIAATVGCTIGFIFATNVAGLIYAFATKGLATAAVIEACGDGWGDL